MTREPDKENTEALQKLLRASESVDLRPTVEDVGSVERVGDGVAFIRGLDGVVSGEELQFESGITGLVFDLGRRLVGALLLGPEKLVVAGSSVRGTGRQFMVPVGDALIGRVVSASGEPLDDRGPIEQTEQRTIDRSPPGPLERQPVNQPLATGIKAIDATVPIGRGQRELILGDRETGKTSIALDAIINQRDGDVLSIYVAVGHRRSTVLQAVQELRQHEAMARTIVISADAYESAAMRYLAPLAAATVAEWFAYNGQHVLIVYDDLSRHAEAYRDLALVLRRAPGREAYPGDIFSLHATLMERSFRLHDDLGGGTVTALPVLETQQGNITGFIPTNLISMTDGQIFLDAHMFAQGQTPAVDIGRSVSRVGGTAQPAALREVTRDLRLQVSQYEEVKDFVRFGAILDEVTRRQVESGSRLMSFLRQTERQPLPAHVQTAGFWALSHGMLNALDNGQVQRVDEALLKTSAQYSHLGRQLTAGTGISDELGADLSRWVNAALAEIGVTASG